MKQLLVIAAAVLGLASCGGSSSEVTCMMLEDGEVKVIPSPEYLPEKGDTVVIKLMSSHSGTGYKVYGKYTGVIPERGSFYYGDSSLCMYSYYKAVVLDK
jgi:hypothetical protein